MTLVDSRSAPLRKSTAGAKAARKPRAVVFDDDDSIRSLLRHFLLMRDYEVLSSEDPTSVCAVNGRGRDFCGGGEACCDILITDVNMPGANGIDLLEQQSRKGCKLAIRNKLVISGALEDGDRERLQPFGYALFLKPFTLRSLTAWLAGCEQRYDLSRPLSSRRREERFDGTREIAFAFNSGVDLNEGVIVNMSASGLCIKVRTPLELEHQLRIENSHFPSSRPAAVRWVRKTAKDAFLAGVHCGTG